SEPEPGTRRRTAWPHEGTSAGLADTAAEIASDRRSSRRPDGHAPSGKRPADLGDADSKSRSASILVLEDEGGVRASLFEALTKAGYKVETALDGPSGLAKLDGERFDVVVTDLALPHRSGFAIARAVKRLHPGTPVVLITGWGHLFDRERLRQHGVDL